MSLEPCRVALNLNSKTGLRLKDPEQCRRVDGSPDDPGISNAWDFSDARGASGGGLSHGA